jgi:DNA (cytosine-5)-methyltransferase 1
MGAAAKRYVAADLFCGGGGFSKGFALACEDLGIRNVRLIAINHSKVAVETHKANHPWAEHHCARVDQLDPRKLVPEGRMKILIASPECTNHANARGGRPINDQSRATAWDVVKWAQELYIENILIENVREIMEWGPLGADRRPLKSKKGEIFAAWLEAIRRCGYKLEHRILNAADFGGATTRQRFFLIARRGPRKVVWPEPSHSKDASTTGDLFRGLKPWRAAREVIDWSIKGTSIFRREELGLKPLAENTIARIEAGLLKFGGVEKAGPFLVVLRGTRRDQVAAAHRSVSEPVPAISAGGIHAGLVEPFLVGLEQTKSNGAQVRTVQDPIPSVTTAGRIGLVEPFILQQQSGGVPRSTSEPLPSIASKGAQALVEPFIVGCGGPQRGGKPQSVDKPLGAVLCRNHKALVQPFVIQVNHGTSKKRNNSGRVRSVDQPLTTITAERSHGLVQPFLVPNFGEREGQKPRTHSIDEPLPAVTSHGAGALVQPFLVKYNRTGKANSIDKPMPTVTAVDRHALVEPHAAPCQGGVMVDILFRMLEPHELAKAMGFEGYEFKGSKKHKVKMIGNAVEVNTAKALIRAILGPGGP